MIAALLIALLQAPAPPEAVPPAPDAPATAQAPAAEAPATQAPATPAARGDYEVGPGDVLEVNVYGNEDLSRVVTVQTNGTISYPLLGEVQVAGLTVAEVQRKITNLLEKDYLVKPQVEVKVREYQSQFVSVVGEVNSPGRKPLRGRTRLIDLLTEAGGFKPTASGDVIIARTEGELAEGQKSITVRITRSTSPSMQDLVNLELPLKNGDIVTALPKSYVTVDGEVNRPGRYAIEADLTVTGAVSLAGGLTRFGSSDVKVRRTDPGTGKVSILEVDLKEVRNGKKPDVPLVSNDVISVSRRMF
ncbi:MAG TPA: polysaccharide biosynthesis/export family protein [Vicinamibacteria bacterium]|nr:polysaccharide biosynthesis/export family protein [Vicinamibacteria bacterium]